MPDVAFDWSAKSLQVTFDGETVSEIADLPALLALLGDTPHRIGAERTFESYSLARRRAFIEAAGAAGHELRTFSPRLTSNRRRAKGWEKTDQNDARVIYELAFGSEIHTRAPRAVPDDPAGVAERERINDVYNRARYDGGEAELAARAAAILGPYGDLPLVSLACSDDDHAACADADLRRIALGDGTDYTPAVIAAVMCAAEAARSRDHFERILQLSGSGHPSRLRAAIHHSGYRMRNGGMGRSFRRESKLLWRHYRRGLRQAYAVLKAAGVGPA